MEDNKKPEFNEEETPEIIKENIPDDETTMEINGFVKEEKPASLGKEIFEWVQAIVVAFVIAMFLRTFVFTMVVVDGTSMEPTLHHGERMVVSRMGNDSLDYGDVVIFRPEQSPETPYIKRVIATEGQTVSFDFETGVTLVNGVALDEYYIYDTIDEDKFGTFNPYTQKELVVPEGHIFVMGDNRNNSRDSRVIGMVNVDDVIGKAVLRFWPINRFGGGFNVQ